VLTTYVTTQRHKNKRAKQDITGQARIQGSNNTDSVLFSLGARDGAPRIDLGLALTLMVKSGRDARAPSNANPDITTTPLKEIPDFFGGFLQSQPANLESAQSKRERNGR